MTSTLTTKEQAAASTIRNEPLSSIGRQFLAETGDSSKKDSGKTKFSLVPRTAYRALAELYTLGATKYTPRGWETGMAWSRIQDALERHYNDWCEGIDYDKVDGQHHLIAVAWCAFALYCYQQWGRGEDDRPNYS